MFRIALVAAFLVTAHGLAFPTPKFNGVGRIIGGSDATIEEVPYQALIILNDGTYFCGGSIVSANAVVSAARCNLGEPSNFTVRVGTNEAWSSGSTAGQSLSVSQIIEHEHFDGIFFDYDVAIFILSSSITLGTTASAIALPTQGQSVTTGTSALISGFGELDVDGTFPAVLQKMTVPIIDQVSCIISYDDFGWWVSDRMICASLPGGGTDASLGDWGGPMVINNVLIGIASWGYGYGYPGVYTRVPLVSDWIKTHAGL